MPNLGDYSRRCERQFRSKNEIMEVWDRPRDLSVVEFRNIFVEVLAPMVRHTCTCWLKTPSYHSFYPSPGCTCLVNFVNWLNLSHLINSSHPLHRSPDPQSVRKLGLNTSNSMNPSHPLHLSPEPLAYANLVNCLNTLSSFPILVFCLQIVRELGQMFEYLPLDHPIFHPSPVVRELGQSFECLSSLIMSSQPLLPSPGCTWTWWIVWRRLIWLSHPILFIHLVCTWTWSIVLNVWRPLLWSSYCIAFISLQRVSVHDQLFEDRSDDPIPSSPSVSWICCIVWKPLIPSHFLHKSPDRTWTWSITWRSFIWSSPSSMSSIMWT